MSSRWRRQREPSRGRIARRRQVELVEFGPCCLEDEIAAGGLEPLHQIAGPGVENTLPRRDQIAGPPAVDCRASNCRAMDGAEDVRLGMGLGMGLGWAGIANGDQVATAPNLKTVQPIACDQCLDAGAWQGWQCLEVEGWGSIRQTDEGPRIEYRRQKTKRSGGVQISIPIHPDLAAVLEACPKDQFTFRQTIQKRSRSAKAFGGAVRDWCDEAGLGECSSHGLRKAICRLADAGATPHQMMAIAGHKTLAMVQHNTEAANREGSADSAMGLLIARPNQEKNVVNLPHRFAKKTSNPL